MGNQDRLGVPDNNSSFYNLEKRKQKLKLKVQFNYTMEKHTNYMEIMNRNCTLTQPHQNPHFHWLSTQEIVEIHTLVTFQNISYNIFFSVYLS